MKTIVLRLTAAAALIGLLCAVRAQEALEEEGPTFPDVLEAVENIDTPEPVEDVAVPLPEEGEASELTEEQEKEMRENLEKTAEIYDEVLKYDPTGRINAVKGNLRFVKQRLVKAEKAKKETNAQLKSLDKSFLDYGKRIEKMSVPQQVKDERLRTLKRETDVQRDYLENRLRTLDSQIVRLQRRLEALEFDHATIVPDGDAGTDEDPWEKKDQQEADKARNALEQAVEAEKDGRAASIDLGDD